MIRVLIVFCVVSFAQIFGGVDDRQDVVELRGRERAVSNAVVTLISREGLTNVRENTFRVLSSELRNDPGFCNDENFSNQRSAPGAQCSGVLIAPDVVMTAGHCVESQAACRTYVYVFGFNSQNINQTMNRDSMYECSELLHQELDELRDAAFIRLDRPVNGVAPLAWRRTGSLNVGDSVYTIGTPFGLPLLRAEGSVRYVSNEAAGVSTDIDSFSGNSGGPVLNSRNHMIEGILVQGEPNPQAFFDPRSGCLRWESATEVETDTYRPYGFRNEIVTRTRVIPVSDILPFLEIYGSSGRPTGESSEPAESID